MTATIVHLDELAADHRSAFEALARALTWQRAFSSRGFVTVATIAEHAGGLGQQSIRAALRSMPRDVVVEVKRGNWAVHSTHKHLAKEALNAP